MVSVCLSFKLWVMLLGGSPFAAGDTSQCQRLKPLAQSLSRLKPTSAGKHKFPYHQKIRFFQKIRFLVTINPLSPQIRCTNGWYEDFRSPALDLTHNLDFLGRCSFLVYTQHGHNLDFLGRCPRLY
jgi:hypothetical protein